MALPVDYASSDGRRHAWPTRFKRPRVPSHCVRAMQDRRRRISIDAPGVLGRRGQPEGDRAVYGILAAIRRSLRRSGAAVPDAWEPVPAHGVDRDRAVCLYGDACWAVAGNSARAPAIQSRMRSLIGVRRPRITGGAASLSRCGVCAACRGASGLIMSSCSMQAVACGLELATLGFRMQRDKVSCTWPDMVVISHTHRTYRAPTFFR